ncbi:MAG TPA: hypothetical protein VEK33_17595 [Terriglobales bacterium]|nr:hypothetical protein [Terriglobales bacterium]
MSPRFLLLLFPFFTLTLSLSPAGSPLDANPAASMERKLEHIRSNSRLPHPDPTPTVFTEDEINAYLADSRTRFPAGVESVHFQEDPGMVTAALKIDFDELKAGRTAENPLLSIFTGVHDVVARAHAHGADGKAFVAVDSVSIDKVEIPRLVLQLFVDRYLRPQYPQAGLDSEFALPAKIDTGVVGSHRLTLTQS